MLCYQTTKTYQTTKGCLVSEATHKNELAASNPEVAIIPVFFQSAKQNNKESEELREFNDHFLGNEY